MAKQATYEIVINGVKESIAAVESLNKQLDALEKRISELGKKNINISTSGGGNAKALDEEAKILQQIDQLHQKVAASEKAEYQELLHAKEELKEYQTIAKSIAAQENLKSGINDTSTMMGAKAQLRDLKAAMQTVDMNGDQFKQWAAEANELTQKLKEAEQSYGQFGRNVGNYADGVAQGMSKLKFEIGGVTVEFDNATKAYRTLKKEMETLSAKQDLGTISEEEAKRLKDLVPVVKQLGSSIQDAGKPMDALLDSMQSFVALAQAGKGLSAFFGLDDDAINESIQKLVALQNVMQSIQTIQNQLDTKEGIGKWLTQSNQMIDTFSVNISKAVAGLLKMDKSAVAASKGVKVLSASLKVLGGLGVAAAIIAITAAIDILKRKQEKANKAAEEAEAAAEKVKQAIDDQRNAYVNASAQYMNTASRLSHLRAEYQATNDQLQKTAILEEASAEFKKLGINIKGVNDAQTMLVKNGNKVIEMLKLQGDAAAISSLRMEAFKKSFNMLLENGYDANSASILAGYNETVVALDKRLDSLNPKIAKLQKELGVNNKDNSKTIKSNANKEADAIRQAEEMKNALKLRLMRDGLAKELLQLDENNRKEIEKIKKNGKDVRELTKLQEEATAKERKKIWDKYNEEIIKNTNQAELKAAQERVDALTADIEEISQASEIYFEPASNEDFWLSLFPSAKTLKEAKKMAKDLIDTYGAVGTTFDDFSKMKYGNLEKYAIGDYFEDFANGKVENDMLVNSLEERMHIIDVYQEKEMTKIQERIKDRYEIQKAALNDEKKLALQELNTRTSDSYIQGDELQEFKKRGEYEKALEYNKKVYQQYLNEKEALKLEYSNREKELEKNTQDDIEKFNTIFYEQSLSAFNDYMSKMNELIDKQPQYTNLGFVNLKETKKQYDEVIKTAERSLSYLRGLQQELQNDKNVLPGDRKALNKQISDQEKQLRSIIRVAEQGMVDAKAEFKKQIQDIVNEVSQTAQQMISAFGDLYNYNIDKQLDALDDRNKILEDKLSKQEEIVDKYSSEINDIEDELANSRGSRREFLIDQLNSEMEARREAMAEQKRIEQEQKALERKQEELEKKKARAQYKRDLAQILISGAMAAANGYATKPFLPTGLAMGALATTLAAAQVAIIRHNKPYAKGGLLEGPSHKHGGIPVGNTGIEVEGKEYVIRKESTANNVNLLDFINKSRRKLTLSDFIDYYEGRKNNAFRNMSGKYAEGGQLPTMPNIDLGDVMTDVAILRDNRPIYVAVTDINKKQDDVRRVQVLSGLK